MICTNTCTFLNLDLQQAYATDIAERFNITKTDALIIQPLRATQGKLCYHLFVSHPDLNYDPGEVLAGNILK